MTTDFIFYLLPTLKATVSSVFHFKVLILSVYSQSKRRLRQLTVIYLLCFDLQVVTINEAAHFFLTYIWACWLTELSDFLVAKESYFWYSVRYFKRVFEVLKQISGPTKMKIMFLILIIPKTSGWAFRYQKKHCEKWGWL